MVKRSLLFGTLISAALLTACGEPVKQSDIQPQPAEAPPPAPEVIAEPLSTLQICLNEAKDPEAEKACWSAELSDRDQALEQYRRAAADRLEKEGASAETFDASQAEWTKYRDDFCQAVSAYWQNLNGGDAKTLECRATLAAARTHAIWSNFLTHDDDTAPSLPEPIQ